MILRWRLDWIERCEDKSNRTCTEEYRVVAWPKRIETNGMKLSRPKHSTCSEDWILILSILIESMSSQVEILNYQSENEL